MLTRLIGNQITTERAAELLGLSIRQVRRKVKRYIADGVASIPHGNRGKTPHNALAPEAVARIAELTGKDGPYHDFNVCHTCDMHGIAIGRPTLHKLPHPKPATPAAEPKAPRGPIRRRRLRKSAPGMMVQIDGSPHARAV